MLLFASEGALYLILIYLIYYIFFFQSLPDRDLTLGLDYHWLTFQVIIAIRMIFVLPLNATSFERTAIL